MKSCIIGVAYGDALQNYPAHTHSFDQMIYVRKGASVLILEDGEYAVQAPAVVFVSHLKPHAFRIESDVYERYSVNIDHTKAARNLKKPALLSMFSARPEQSPVLPVDGERQMLDSLIPLLMEENEQAAGDGDVTDEDLLRLILIRLRRRHPTAFSACDSGIAGTVWSVKNELDRHVDRDIPLAELAEKHNTNLYYLAHSFKRLTGYSIKKYQLLARLSSAQELLASTDLSVSDVCLQVGFSNFSNFSRYFRLNVGCTPSQYRKNLKNHAYPTVD